MGFYSIIIFSRLMVWHSIKWHTGCQRIFAIIQILTDRPVSDIIK